MAREISVSELRKATAEVIADIESCEELALTVNRRSVADIVPRATKRSPWVPASELRRIVSESPADRDLLNELAELQAAQVDGA